MNRKQEFSLIGRNESNGKYFIKPIDSKFVRVDNGHKLTVSDAKKEQV